MTELDEEYEEEVEKDSRKNIREKARFAQYVAKITEALSSEPNGLGSVELGEHEFDLIIDGKEDLGCHEDSEYRLDWYPANDDGTIRDDSNVSLEIIVGLFPGEPAKYSIFVEEIREITGDETLVMYFSIVDVLLLTDDQINAAIQEYKTRNNIVN